MIIDGKAMAAKKLDDLKSKALALKTKPKLAALIVGEDPASVMYVNLKAKRAAEVGVESEIVKMGQDVREEEIISQIKKWNEDPTVTGILVQLPLPEKINTKRILRTIGVNKDVDGLNGSSEFLPATVKAVLAALEGYKISGQDVTIVGRSEEVGKPLALALIDLGATVTVCHSKTRNLGEKTAAADILISATGQPGMISKGMVKEGAVVIDVGSPQGDVDFENVSKVARAITPVPGGVGPLTVVSLLENTLSAAYNRENTHT